MPVSWRGVGIAVAVVLGVVAGPAHADRLVLAPSGLITIPNSAKIEFASTFKRPSDYMGWVSIGLPGSLNGFELEAERFEEGGRRRQTGSIQYSFTGNAFTNIAPAISVGIRDVANEGPEGRAFFAAASKTIPLPERLERTFRDLRVDAGYGTSHIGGAYIGVQSKLSFGLTLSAEALARRFNASAAFPVGKHFDLRAYSLNGHVFYGASLLLVK